MFESLEIIFHRYFIDFHCILEQFHETSEMKGNEGREEDCNRQHKSPANSKQGCGHVAPTLKPKGHKDTVVLMKC